MEVRGVLFEWDAAKAEINVAKHGLSFLEAANAVADYHIHAEAEALRNGEARRLRFVDFHGRVITVIFVLRDHGMRLISVRHARRSEKENYERVRLAKDKSI